MDRVDRMHEPERGVVPAREQLAELPRLAYDDDRALGIPRSQPLDDVFEPCAVQRPEALDDAGDRAAVVVDRDGRGGHMPIGVAGDHREADDGASLGIRDHAIVERGVGLTRVRGRAQPRRGSPCGAAASSNRLRMRAGSTTRSRPRECGAVLRVLGGVPGSRVSSRAESAAHAWRRPSAGRGRGSPARTLRRGRG